MAEGVLVAMSGGVDSSVAAALLRAEGYDCLGVTMRLFPDGKGGEDAAAAARRLGFPHEILDCAEAFERQVIDKFIRVYEAGGTPNPCVDCNRHLKFGGLLRTARERGLDFIATGHYARIERAPSGRWLLKRGVDHSRDQSYFLYTLTQDQLSRTLFPLGGMTKAQVRARAAAAGLVNADKPGSQDICFVPDGDYAGFIARHTGRSSPPGDFVDERGRVLGRHRGIIHYTIGQRRGLGVAVGRPLYVSAIDAAANTVTLSGEDSILSRRAVALEDVNFIALPALEGPLRAAVKLRYRQEEAPATVTRTGETSLLVEFDAPQRAPALGQAAVLYDGETVLGGGTVVGAG